MQFSSRPAEVSMIQIAKLFVQRTVLDLKLAVNAVQIFIYS